MQQYKFNERTEKLYQYPYNYYCRCIIHIKSFKSPICLIIHQFSNIEFDFFVFLTFSLSIHRKNFVHCGLSFSWPIRDLQQIGIFNSIISVIVIKLLNLNLVTLKNWICKLDRLPTAHLLISQASFHQENSTVKQQNNAVVVVVQLQLVLAKQ